MSKVILMSSDNENFIVDKIVAERSVLIKNMLEELSENFTSIDKILKIFDLTYKYGPSKGISRLDRWNRAERLNLRPPIEIKKLLLSHEGFEMIT
ncbi:hypothetical protein PCK1_001537 [Pneumocystis canis]|nr:hypothetical protein PCK1_001537 [Pneumocystis canis]